MKPFSAHRLTRRELLSRGVACGTALVIGPGFIAHTGEAWASEVMVLQPATMATLIQIARDIFPHDRLGDRYYAASMKGYDADEHKDMIEAGVASLNALAVGRGNPSYVDTGWEVDRVAMLREIEKTPFFQTVRGGMVVSLYNNKDVWEHFGYEGESFSKGGYLNHGFDDIDWI